MPLPDESLLPQEHQPATMEVAIADPAPLRGLVEVDTVLLDEAVATINRIYVGKGLELYFAVGDYVLNTFFVGDPETFHARGKGHATFRALAEREDLRLGYSALYKAVAVVEQRRLLPDNLASVLSFEHQVKLLPVKDENEKVELARRAVQEDLSSRDLAAEVKRLKESQRDGAKLGRPSLPAFVKAFGHLRKIRDQALTESITTDSLTNFGPEKARFFLADVEHWIGGIQAIVEQARCTLDACSAPAATEELRDADEVQE